MTGTTVTEKRVSIRIPIPEGITVTLNGTKVTVAGPKGMVERELGYPGIRIQLEQRDATSEVMVISDSPRKKVRAIAGTYASHIKNMMAGVKSGFFYKLAIVYAHFPLQVALTKEGNAVAISNFLGERKPRLARIEEGVKVEIRGKEIIVSGIDKEAVGQTAANIEQATRIKGYDPRVFQDGIYLVAKGVGLGQ